MTSALTIWRPEPNNIYHMDALLLLRAIEDASVDLIVTDPPYGNFLNLDWDKQWSDAEEYITWIGALCKEWQRVLKPNGSLYIFASPQMAARVEVEIGRWFNVLNQIAWSKPYSHHLQADIEITRRYFPQTERIIFAEQKTQVSEWSTVCGDIHAYVMKPLKDWFRDAAKTNAITLKMINRAVGSVENGGGMASHYFGDYADFQLPTKEMYTKMQAAYPEAFDREYEDLRREYEDLRREYEDLRRPFNVTPFMQYTDVWTFNTVQAYEGKHPAEKPLPLIEQIINASSRKGDLVLDSFMGSGTTAIAARNLGRQYIGSEISEIYVKMATDRLAMPYMVDMFTTLGIAV